jgi:hypothetical protein
MFTWEQCHRLCSQQTSGEQGPHAKDTALASVSPSECGHEVASCGLPGVQSQYRPRDWWMVTHDGVRPGSWDNHAVQLTRNMGPPWQGMEGQARARVLREQGTGAAGVLTAEPQEVGLELLPRVQEYPPLLGAHHEGALFVHGHTGHFCVQLGQCRALGGMARVSTRPRAPARPGPAVWGSMSSRLPGTPSYHCERNE